MSLCIGRVTSFIKHNVKDRDPEMHFSPKSNQRHPKEIWHEGPH